MTLDEIERLARDCIHRGGADYSELEMSQLAAALLAVLPVVRAGEACRDSPDNLHDEADAFRRVCRTVNDMRLKLGGN